MTELSAGPWLTSTADGVVLHLRVVPRASKSEISGPHGDTLKVRLAAPPVNGAANRALLSFLAEVLGVRERAVTILSGERSRRKSVHVEGLAATTALERIRLSWAHERG